MTDEENKAGAKRRDENPSDKVQALVQALEQIAMAPQWALERPGGDQLYGTYSLATVSVAREALAAWSK